METIIIGILFTTVLDELRIMVFQIIKICFFLFLLSNKFNYSIIAANILGEIIINIFFSQCGALRNKLDVKLTCLMFASLFIAHLFSAFVFNLLPVCSQSSALFVTCSKEDIRVWSTETNRELLRIKVANMWCNGICIKEPGDLIISGRPQPGVQGFESRSRGVIVLSFCSNSNFRNRADKSIEHRRPHYFWLASHSLGVEGDSNPGGAIRSFFLGF